MKNSLRTFTTGSLSSSSVVLFSLPSSLVGVEELCDGVTVDDGLVLWIVFLSAGGSGDASLEKTVEVLINITVLLVFNIY